MNISDLPLINPSSLLFIGSPGTGKTSTIIQLFGDSGLAILDCDNNIQGALPYIRKLYNGKLPPVEFFVPTMDNGIPVPRPQRYGRAAKQINTWMADPKIKTIYIDTLTSLTEMAMDEVRRQQNRKIADGIKDFIDDPFREQDWGSFKFLMKHLVITLKASGKTVIFGGHINVTEDKLTDITQEFLSIPGSLKTELASLFSEVWLLTIEEERKPGGVEYKRQIRIAPKASQQKLGLKSAVGLLPTQFLDIPTLKKLLIP